VAGLVYVAAHMPDAGENESDDGKRFPSDLSKSNAIKKTAVGFTYLDPAQFHDYFAADLSAEQAAFMARSQVLNLADNFKAVITTAAWRSKPNWMLVATKNRTINPDLERWHAERAKSHKVEVSGASHAVYVFQAEGSRSSDRRSCHARPIDKHICKTTDRYRRNKGGTHAGSVASSGKGRSSQHRQNKCVRPSLRLSPGGFLDRVPEVHRLRIQRCFQPRLS